MISILTTYWLYIVVGGVGLALLGIYCLCRAAGRDARRAEALMVQRLRAEDHAANLEAKGREEDAYARGYGSDTQYRHSLWRS